MKLSSKSRELAKLEYIKLAEQASTKHQKEIERIRQTMPRSGAKDAAIDRELIELANDLVQAKIATCLEAFRRDNVVPSLSDIDELVPELEQIVRGVKYNPLHHLLPSSQDAFMTIVPRARRDFIIEMKRRELEQNAPPPVAPLAPNPTNQSVGIVEPASSRGISVDDVDMLELKPNIFGIGLNLNQAIKRLARWWKSRNIKK